MKFAWMSGKRLPFKRSSDLNKVLHGYALISFRDVRLYGQNLRMQNRATGAGMPGNQNRYSHKKIALNLLFECMS